MANLEHIQNTVENLQSNDWGAGDTISGSFDFGQDDEIFGQGDEVISTQDKDEGNAESSGIGAIILGVLGSVAGGLVGAIGGPIGVFAGAWIGGLIGSVSGTLVEQAVRDIFDDDDLTQWHKLSKGEQKELIEVAFFEILAGWLPGVFGGLITKSGGRLATKLGDKVKAVISRILPGGAGRAAAAALDVGPTQIVLKELARLPKEARREIMEPFVRRAIAELEKETGKSGAKFTKILDDFIEKGTDHGNIIKWFEIVTANGTGAKLLDDWYKSNLMAGIRRKVGFPSLLKNVATPNNDEVWGDDAYANKGGYINPREKFYRKMGH